MTDIEERLDDLRERGLYRRMRLVSGPQGPRVLLDGKPGAAALLEQLPRPGRSPARARGGRRGGDALGRRAPGASRLVSGNMTVHRRLEEQLADFKGSEACVLFGSGYLANAGVVSTLAREGDVVFSDALNHASIVDGCRLSQARETFVYDHCDIGPPRVGAARGRGARER